MKDYDYFAKGGFSEFLEANGAELVGIKDGGMYGQRVAFIFKDGGLFKCHAYDSQHGPFTASTSDLSPAEWFELYGIKSEADWRHGQWLSKIRQIDSEVAYLARCRDELAKFSPETEADHVRLGRMVDHITARTESLDQMQAELSAFTGGAY